MSIPYPIPRGHTEMNDDTLNAEREASALVIGRDALLELWLGLDNALDPLDRLLVAAVLQANVDPATTSLEDQIRYGTLNRPMPDEIRRPVSISRLADSMDLRFETVRRRVNRLKTLGVFVTTPAGVLAPESYGNSPGNAATVRAIDGLAERTYRHLVRHHYFSNSPLPSPAHQPEQHPYRAVARLFMTYALRMLLESRPFFGDFTNQLLVMRLNQMNTADLGDARRWDPVGDIVLPTIPDPVRLPISVASLARETGMTVETTRRRLVDLAEQGICRRVEGGYITVADNIKELRMSLVSANRMNLTRLYRNCALVGAIEGWDLRMRPRKAS